MPEDYEQLQRKVEEGLAAARELKRLKAEQQRKTRPKLKLIKGGGVGVIWAGVEWLLDPRKVAVALVAAAVSTGATISDYPGNPGSDPPEPVIPPVSTPAEQPEPSVKPAGKSTVKPRPPRTSPLRTLGRSSAPVAAPSPRKTTKTPQKSPSETPTRTPVSSATPVETPPIIETPELQTPDVSCVVDLLGVKVCLR